MARNRDPDKFCIECGVAARVGGSEYCYWHNPDISAKEKRESRAKGGHRSRVIPHDLNSRDILPINNSEDLKRFLNAILAKSVDEVEDIKQLVKVSMPILDRFNTALELELVAELTERLRILEAKQNGKLLEAGEYEYSNDT